MGQFVDAGGDFSWGKEVVRKTYIPSHEVMFSQLGFHIWVAVRIIPKKNNVPKKTTAQYIYIYIPVLSQVPLFSHLFVRRHSVCSPRVREAWFLFSPKFDWVAHEGLGVIAISFLYRLQHVTTRSTNHSLRGNWGTLRIPREDWGTLGNIGENLGQSLPLLRILLTQLTCMSTLSFLNHWKVHKIRTEWQHACVKKVPVNTQMITLKESESEVWL